MVALLLVPLVQLRLRPEEKLRAYLGRDLVCGLRCCLVASREPHCFLVWHDGLGHGAVGCPYIRFTPNGACYDVLAHSFGYNVFVWLLVGIIPAKRYATRVSGNWFVWLAGSLLVH